LNFEGPGDHEKKFGRYFVDFFSETERLDLRFIRAQQAEMILLDDWGDQSYIKFKQLVMEALKSAE